MSAPTPAVNQQRIVSLESRIKTLEGIDREDRTRESDRYATIIERLAKLETRVALIAGGAGVLSSILVIAVKGAVGG